MGTEKMYMKENRKSQGGTQPGRQTDEKVPLELQ